LIGRGLYGHNQFFVLNSLWNRHNDGNPEDISKFLISVCNIATAFFVGSAFIPFIANKTQKTRTYLQSSL
jgi:hypothetical protein